MTGPEARALRERMGVTQIELAQKLGVSTRTYQRWERDGLPKTGELLLNTYKEACC